MRKTRLVILPTKCLHQMGFLLLFLSCPVIGDWGRIRPETENAHLAIQRARGGTCGLQRNLSRELLIYRNLSNQCFKDANVEDYNFKPKLTTNADTRGRKGLIKIERKDTANKRNIQARLTRISENRRPNVVEQRRILNNLRQTETVQNWKLISDRKVIQNVNNRISSRNNNANFRRLSLARIQVLGDVGTRNDVLSKLSVRQYRNNREQFMEKNILKNSLSRKEATGDKKSRNLNERLGNHRNDKFSRSQVQNNDIRRQNDRTISERLEKEQMSRQKAVDRQAKEESVKSNNRLQERRNSRQESNKNFSRTKFSERESLMPIKSEERSLSSTNKRLTIRNNNDIMRARFDAKSRRILQKSVEENINIRQGVRRTRKDETRQDQRSFYSRQFSPEILMLQKNKKDFSYTLSRKRNVNRLNDKVTATLEFDIFKTTMNRNVIANDKDTRRNIISVNALSNKKSGEKRVKENLEIHQLKEYLIPNKNEEKNEDFIHTFLKWSNLTGYNSSKMKDWIGNCFIGAAAYYLTSRQVKVL